MNSHVVRDTRTDIVAALVDDAHAGFLVVDDAGSRFIPLSDGVYELGRESTSALRILDDVVSRQHATLVVRDGRATIEDLGSKNGTRVDGRRIEALVPVHLARGSVVEIGRCLVVLQGGDAAIADRAEPTTTTVPSIESDERPWMRLADRVARDTATVLLLGETGVGKEVVAERIHAASDRAGRPFVRVHPAAISPALFESELFGHERGSFTGATREHVGLVERADGGTLFIDEIGELTADAQVKLLRLLEDRVVRRVGGRTERRVDVRFVAATHRDLEAEIERGRFRADLYFRLSNVVLRIPPLRERRGEIAGLARGFVASWCASRGRPAQRLDAGVVDYLESLPWPGNVRELRTAIEHAALLSDGERIRPDDLPRRELERRADSIRPAAPAPASGPPEADATTAPPTGDRREQILTALASTAGNQTEAAKRLGVSRRTLSSWMNELAIPRPRKRSA